MKFYVRAVLGLLIFLSALALFMFGIYQLAKGGSCASGGSYVSTKECAAGSTEWMFALPPAVIVGLCGIWLFALRGARPGTPQPEPGPAGRSGAQATAPSGRAAHPEELVIDRNNLLATLISAGAPATASAADPIVRLEKLQALLNAGVLSPEEFQRAKAKILAEM